MPHSGSRILLSGPVSPLKYQIDQDQLDDRKERNEQEELRFSGLVMEKYHAEDTAKCAETGGKTEQITLRDAESILLSLFLIRVKHGQSEQVHQNEKDQKNHIVIIYESKNKLHTPPPMTIIPRI